MKKIEDLSHERQRLELERDKYKWKNRRLMAYVGLAWSIFLSGYMIYAMDIKRIAALTGTFEWILLLFISIPMTYLGLATFSEIKDSKK